MKVSAKLKEKMLKSKDFSRPVVARNYDSISFNYKGTGRWQLRFDEGWTDQYGTHPFDVYYNGTPIDMFRAKNKVPTLGEIKDTIDRFPKSELRYM